MTDYLEELLEDASSLLEQIRRLERSQAGPAAEEGQSAAREQGRRAGARADRPEEDRAAGRTEPLAEGGRTERSVPSLGLEREGAASLESGGASARRRRDLGPEDRGARPSPLLEELGRLERAAGFAAGPAALEERSGPALRGGTERQAGAAGLPGLPPYAAQIPAAEDGTPSPQIAWARGTGTSPAGGTDWAELADRAFRRDSRRYDGGFYLY